jgi:CubicO group peptidase (beta-lactamase class C family)
MRYRDILASNLAPLLAALLIGAGTAHGQAADAMVWPTDEWTVRPPGDETRARPTFQALEAYLFPPDFDEQARAGVRTDGVVVVQGGVVVYERYGRSYTADMAHPAWSVTKVVVDGLYGAAVQEGLLAVDDPVAAHSDLLAGDRSAITFLDLLKMTSGLDFQEGYEFAPLRSSAVAMLYTRGRDDMGRFAAGHEVAHPPGSTWSYASGDSLMLMAALRDVVGPERYAEWPWTALFDPIGMDATFERDASGTFVGSSYLFATPRDLARYGLLYLRDGVWQDRRLLPEGWAAQAGAPGPVPFYGRHWWTNRTDAGGERPWPDAPEDTIAGLGHWGQKLVVIPSRDLVIVRTGDDRDRSFDTNRFVRLVLDAFPARAP